MTRHRPTTVLFGGTGMVGRAVLEVLRADRTCELLAPTRQSLNLLDQHAVREFYRETQPSAVLMCAGRVGGIRGNLSDPVAFGYENAQMALNVIRSASDFGVERLLYLGSACIYPRVCEQPILEESLLTGALEPSNESYAIAKILGVKLCRAYSIAEGRQFISAMPTNLYGPHDHFDLQTSHVVPAFLRKFHEAKLCSAPSVTCWGSGSATREFMHVDDAASAIVHCLEHYHEPEPINIGTGVETSIRQLAELIADVVGYVGQIHWDTSQPEGAPRRTLDCSKLSALGWKSSIDFHWGLKQVYRWYLSNYDAMTIREDVVTKGAVGQHPKQ